MSSERTNTDRSDEELPRMTFADHFVELRRRVLTCLAAVAILFVVCYIFQDILIDIIVRPYEAYRESQRAAGRTDPGPLVYIGVSEGFFFYLKSAFFGSLLLSAPVILHQMWRFIGAGLYRVEKKSVMRILPFSIALFAAGMLFGYFVLFPIGMRFLLSFPNPELLEANITVSMYSGLFFMLILVMGFVFQAPLVMVVTTSIGITTPELFTSKRRYFILGAFVAAAIFTPPDAVTQSLLAIPLVGLFEAGILLSKRVSKKKRAAAEARDRKRAPETERAG